MNVPLARSRASPKVVLCASSSGGHWRQLQMLSHAWAGHVAVYATTSPFGPEAASATHYHLMDCNLSTPLRFPAAIASALHVVRTVRPEVVVSTGALPGLICIILGRMFGARTLWVESLANTNRLSLSGKVASYVAARTYVQSAKLADGKRTFYAGEIL